ncbi:aminoglycoside phosphotransferase family protein [Microlunatus speluncae]|uniref:aminoglycoside phosphotransferase family protein n=1 Tax=Microlunatus speluncae TaxID=2594267 RepID=UPI0012665560|nr:aminoglycoside phosphotransferase family protein [Microlunatus speluncae]
MITLPARLRAKASLTTAGQAWLATLPELCRRLAADWSVRLGEPFDECHVSLVVAADRAGEPVALKVPLPVTIELGTLAAGVRSAEAAALRVWAGAGAVRLLEHDHETGALLIERCVPGEPLARAGDADEADLVAVAMLDRLHGAEPPPGTFDRLTDRAARLARELPERFERLQGSFDRRWLEPAIADLAALSAGGTAEVLLHGDFHHDNILAAEREPWLAIDPLPMLGDPAYDAVQFLLFRKGDLAEPAVEWDRVISRFCGLLGVEAERVKAWMFVRLITDAVAAAEEGVTSAESDAWQGDLWTARLVHRLRK